MSYITYEMMNNLKSVGFTFPAYEHFLNMGMVFHYDGSEYFIGGSCISGYSEMDKAVAKEGCWLPTETELLEWLQMVNFDVDIQMDAHFRYFKITATDNTNSATYNAGGWPLSFALESIIYKICKSKTRPYLPGDIERLEISTTVSDDT